MLAPVSEAEGIAHVYMAGHNHAMKMERLDHLKQGLRNASSGKGVSETQAKVSALCEAVERYSGERSGGEVTVTMSYAEMRDRHGEDAIHPNAVMRFSERQLAEFDQWNAKKSKFNRVTEALPADQPIDWTPLWSLSHERHKYLPTQLVYYASPASAACDKFYSFGCSNGNASGNTLEEAILQGFFELVERDAVALWWYNRLRKPGVAAETFNEPWLQELSAYYRQRFQRETWALDLTSDLGIPVFVAVSKMLEGKEERLLFGLGCHLDARIALQRAFAEMNQMLGMAHVGADGEMILEEPETLQ
jgi:ribosomal protein S12 methylthiotransferase accessory factor